MCRAVQCRAVFKTWISLELFQPCSEWGTKQAGCRGMLRWHRQDLCVAESPSKPQLTENYKILVFAKINAQMLNMQHHVTKNACSAHRLPTDIAYPTGGRGGSSTLDILTNIVLETTRSDRNFGSTFLYRPCHRYNFTRFPLYFIRFHWGFLYWEL